MSIPQKPVVTYPVRVPLKIIGSAQELRAEAIAEIIYTHSRGKDMTLPLEWPEELEYSSHAKGAWISHTFWIILPDEHFEKPLREAIQKLPGIVMQL
jgi:putative lipoic acid-binding regulatory protein